MGMRPRGPRSLLAVLTALVLAELLHGQAWTQPRQVNGVLGGAVLLSPALPPNRTVKEIEWSFSPGTGATIQVAELGRGGFERPDPKDRFKDRLEAFNQTGLRISALQRGDSGVYGARIKLHPAMVEDQFFNLSIYEPVPAPEIQQQQLSISTHGCNVTLRCWVPGGSGAEVSWQLSSAMGPVWGWLCGGSHMLCLALPSSAFNSSYSCVARNPIQERSISIRMDTLCRLQAALVPISSEDAPLEPLYSKIQMAKPLEWQHEHPPPTYSEVRAGGGAAIAQQGRWILTQLDPDTVIPLHSWILIQSYPCTDGSSHSWILIQSYTFTAASLHSWILIQSYTCTDGSLHSWILIQSDTCTAGSLRSWILIQSYACTAGSLHSWILTQSYACTAGS
ncbi:SLAM family member 8-like [Amazona ochrocephala]